MQTKPPASVTTQDLKTLWRKIEAVYGAWVASCRTSDERDRADLWRAQTLYCIARVRKHSARHISGSMVADLFAYSLEEWQGTLEFVGNAPTDACSSSASEIATLKAENARLRAQIENLQRQQTPTTVEIPAQTVTVRSAVDREILRLMATTGLSRSWRLVNRILSAGLTDNANTVRNAIRRLKDQNLIEDYAWNHKVQVWSPGAGGGRQLLRLTARGRVWAEMAFGITMAPCELDELAQRHKGVSHAIAILETLEHLRIAGYRINDTPGSLLVNEDERWGQRSEPDLVAIRDNVIWTVEVQREVNARNNAKWAKSLELNPRLMLITLSIQMCNKQAAILSDVIRQEQLPPGEIRLASLEAMEKATWQWVEFHS